VHADRGRGALGPRELRGGAAAARAAARVRALDLDTGALALAPDDEVESLLAHLREVEARVLPESAAA
jgi:hypothetical protein